jgi:uncharacterized protein (TIGR03435 family)
MFLKLPVTALMASLGWAQSQAVTPAPPAFDVASVKPHVMSGQVGRGRIGVSLSGAGVTVSAMTLTNLLQYAYDLKTYQISGGPAWADSDRWDIAAKADRDRPLMKDDARMMLGTLLADRFHMRFHRAEKDVPLYALRKHGTVNHPAFGKSEPARCGSYRTPRDL